MLDVVQVAHVVWAVRAYGEDSNGTPRVLVLWRRLSLSRLIWLRGSPCQSTRELSEVESPVSHQSPFISHQSDINQSSVIIRQSSLQGAVIAERQQACGAPQPAPQGNPRARKL